MAGNETSFLAVLEPDPDHPGYWSSQALRIPGARLGRVVDENDAIVPGLSMSSGGAMVPSQASPRHLVASVSMPANLRTSGDLEEQKLAFEREKQTMSERWQRRTFVWAILSSVLSLAAGIFGPSLIRHDSPGISIGVDQVEQCRNSLKRTLTLAGQPGTTVGDIGQAVRQHDASCDEMLVSLMGQANKE